MARKTATPAENAAATGTPLPTVALPPLCGPLHQLLGQTGYPGYCRRSHSIYGLHTGQTDIENMRARILTRRDPRRARNLTTWVIEAQERQDRIAAHVLADLGKCTHTDDERAECTVEEAMPGCTC